MQNFFKTEERKTVRLLTKGACLIHGKVDEQIVEVLKKSGKPLTLVEIAEQIGKPPKKVFSSLRKLFEEGKVHCDTKTHTYKLAKQ